MCQRWKLVMLFETFTLHPHSTTFTIFLLYTSTDSLETGPFPPPKCRHFTSPRSQSLPNRTPRHPPLPLSIIHHGPSLLPPKTTLHSQTPSTLPRSPKSNRYPSSPKRTINRKTTCPETGSSTWNIPLHAVQKTAICVFK